MNKPHNYEGIRKIKLLLYSMFEHENHTGLTIILGAMYSTGHLLAIELGKTRRGSCKHKLYTLLEP